MLGIVTSVKAVPAKAYSSISFKLSGNSARDNDLFELKALVFILTILSGNTISVNKLDANDDLPIDVTQSGIITDSLVSV